MIKLTNILRELFATPRNVAKFELLAELKISEIDVILDEGKEGKYNFIGTDLKKAKDEVDKWREEWKKIPGNSGKEPSSKNLEREEGSNRALYNHIYKTFIKTRIATWSDFDFSGLSKRTSTYSETIGTDLEKAKKAIANWKEKWKSKPRNSGKEPSSSYMTDYSIEQGGDATLYNYIKKNIFPLMDGPNFQKWSKLGLKSQTQWSEFDKEDFIEVIKELNLEKNNYIHELANKNPDFYRGILSYMRKNQITNLKQRRDFWNSIGMQYVPQEEKLIYAYEFINVNGVNGDNRVYVGLTNDPNRRYGEHVEIGTKFKSSLNDFKTDIIKQEKLIKQEESIKATENPEILTKEKNQLTTVGKFLQEHPEITSEQVNYIIKTDFMDAYEAAEKEGEILNEYLQNKWTKLNKAKTGSLGGVYKSTRKPKSDSQEKTNIANDIAREMTLSKYKKI